MSKIGQGPALLPRLFVLPEVPRCWHSTLWHGYQHSDTKFRPKTYFSKKIESDTRTRIHVGKQSCIALPCHQFFSNLITYLVGGLQPYCIQHSYLSLSKVGSTCISFKFFLCKIDKTLLVVFSDAVKRESFKIMAICRFPLREYINGHPILLATSPLACLPA